MKRDSVRTKRNAHIYLCTNKKKNRHLFPLCVRDVINILEFLFCLAGHNNRHVHFCNLFPGETIARKNPKKELEIHKNEEKKFKQPRPIGDVCPTDECPVTPTARQKYKRKEIGNSDNSVLCDCG